MDEMTRPRNLKFGPYICIKPIGGGGQSSVFSAMHEATGHMVALRVMSIMADDVPQAVERCKDVMNSITLIDAPNLVSVEDFGNENNVLYIAMNVMYGGSLYQRMKQRGFFDSETLDPPPPAPHRPSAGEVLSITERIATALDHLHSVGVVHGQVSPSNIMFDADGAAYLADVGFTKLMKIIYKLDATNSFNMTHYSAPELWEGERPSAATDQYAFACTVYELLTGQAPFAAPSIFGLMQAHANNVVMPPHYVRKHLPQALAMVFWKALAKPVDKRYTTVTAFYAALKQAFGDDLGKPTQFCTFPLT
jgi:eukaryotic-like serine/threonine-protein kinase